ncbi:MAG: HIT family protein [Alphaproteobacteria bacterium]|nr:HIT family protein [Alphaproteobacteria bacterium]
MPGFVLHKQLEADSLPICDLPLSQVRLQNQMAIPWLVLVPRRAEIREIYELRPDDRAALMEEITRAAQALEEFYAPDKINIGALGNIVPQLHVHVIGRFTTDPVWPAPVWGRLEPAPYTPEAVEEIRIKFNGYFEATANP